MRGVAVPVVAMSLALAAVALAAPPYEALSQRLVGADQGVYVRAHDGTVLAAVEADRAVHPASVSKIPTTLAGTSLITSGSARTYTSNFWATPKARWRKPPVAATARGRAYATVSFSFAVRCPTYQR